MKPKKQIHPEPVTSGKIVVIDDDESMCELIRLHLKNAGYQVSVAEDAIEGGHAVLRTSPDLIIVDVNMPYMNGYEFVSALKSDPQTKEIPVLFITTNDDVGEYAKALGAVAYLKKPLVPDRLLEVVALLAPRAPYTPYRPRFSFSR